VNYLDADKFGLALVDGYSITRGQSTYRMPALLGRPRVRRKDMWPVYRFNVSYEFSKEDFASWQQFWIAAGQGAQPFFMRLKLTTNQLLLGREDYTLVQPVGTWQASLMDGNVPWRVTLTVEASGGTAIVATPCDIYYGGPIQMPSPDNVYGGPITALATDVVGPCPEVNPIVQ